MRQANRIWHKLTFWERQSNGERTKCALIIEDTERVFDIKRATGLANLAIYKADKGIWNKKDLGTGHERDKRQKIMTQEKKYLKDHGFESTCQSERDDALASLMSRSWAVRVRCSPR